VFLFEDECEFHLNPGLSRMWARKGQQPRIPAAGQNQRLPVFGSLDALSGRLLAHTAMGKNSAAFRTHLELLLRTYAGRHIFLFLDNCSIHHAKHIQRFLADHRRALTVIWNAAYTPELNLIERYWKHLKEKAIHNYYFETQAALEQAVRDAVRHLNGSKTLRMTVHLEFLNSLREAA
jgi:transposase